MLGRALKARNVEVTQISFPRYDGFFGKMVGQFLNGDLGPLETVDPHFSALLYAGDRLEAKPAIEKTLADGKILLSDRYVGSNLAHQTARVPAKERAGFLAWLKKLEYEIYKLPVEDLVIYLRTPAAEAHRLVGKKGARGYTKLRRDLLEADIKHLETASKVYDELARQPNWVRVECYDAKARSLRAPEEIHKEILAVVEERVFPSLRAIR